MKLIFVSISMENRFLENQRQLEQLPPSTQLVLAALVGGTNRSKQSEPYYFLSGLKEKVFERKWARWFFLAPFCSDSCLSENLRRDQKVWKKSFSFEWSISKNGADDETITFSIWKWGVGGFLNIKCSVDVSESIFYAKAFMQRFAKRIQARLSQSRIKKFRQSRTKE